MAQPIAQQTAGLDDTQGPARFLAQVSWEMRYYHCWTTLPPMAFLWLLPFLPLKHNFPASKCPSGPCQYPVGLSSFGLVKSKAEQNETEKEFPKARQVPLL